MSNTVVSKGGKSVEITTVSGTVVSEKANYLTETYGSVSTVNGHVSGGVSSETIKKQSIWIKDMEDGSDIHIKFQNLDFPVREGQTISAILIPEAESMLGGDLAITNGKTYAVAGILNHGTKTELWIPKHKGSAYYFPDLGLYRFGHRLATFFMLVAVSPFLLMAFFMLIGVPIKFRNTFNEWALLGAWISYLIWRVVRYFGIWNKQYDFYEKFEEAAAKVIGNLREKHETTNKQVPASVS
jgi:hypothetical protein